MELLDQVAATNTVLNEERHKHIFKQILTGLDYLHGEGICHRDIKPSNILLSSDLEKVCIVDFNVAKSVKDV
jgi:serine/threonine protein kinase